MRNTVSPDTVKTPVVTRATGLLLLAVLAIAFFTSPMVSFAGPSCIGPDDATPGNADPDVPVATLVAAYSVKAGTKPNSPLIFTRDPKFNPATQHPPTTGIELVQVKLNNKIVFGVFRGLGIVMIFQDTASINDLQFVKIKQPSVAPAKPR